MGTITFKSTRFFGIDELNKDSGAEISIENATDMAQRKMYSSETTKTTSDVTYRSYEIYVDPNADADIVTAARLARVTEDPNKTASDGYDIYVSAKPTVGAKLDACGTLTFKNLLSAAADFNVIYIAQDL